MSIDEGVRWGRCRIVNPSAQPMYAAAERWRDESLINDLSLFDGRNIDGSQVAEELVELYVNNPDIGSGSFTSKLAQQLAPASNDAVQVAAELLYVHALIASTTRWSARSKADLVQTVTAFREDGVAPMPPDLVAVLSGGGAGTGQAYLNLRWKMFAYLIEVFRTIKQLPRPARQLAVSSLETFRQAVEGVDTQSVWSQQYALEHLLFPDVAPVILSRKDRDAIASAFPEVGPDILTVGAGLEPNEAYGDRAFVDPYVHPYRSRWNPNPAERTYGEWGRRVAQAVDLGSAERAYKLERPPQVRAALQAAARGDDPHSDLLTALRGFNVIDFRVADTFLTWTRHRPEATTAALREIQDRPGPVTILRSTSVVPLRSAV